jgi:hypothetical protein
MLVSGLAALPFPAPKSSRLQPKPMSHVVVVAHLAEHYERRFGEETSSIKLSRRELCVRPVAVESSHALSHVGRTSTWGLCGCGLTDEESYDVG